MQYTELDFKIIPNSEMVADILAAQLAEIGCDTFVPTENGIQAYLPTNLLDKKNIDEVIAQFPIESVTFSYETTEMPDINWNREWEKNYFTPIVVENKCVIHSTFHTDIPEVEYDIVIDPKMAFGSGHHETTVLMLTEILKAELEGKRVLDMGCGTAVLAILAAKRGAKEIVAIDIDEWSQKNSLENIGLNNTPAIEVLLGDASLLPGRIFDTIFANINRNILINDMHYYAACLPCKGELYMSGYYAEDLHYIEQEANKHQLQLLYFEQNNRWTVAKFIKK